MGGGGIRADAMQSNETEIDDVAKTTPSQHGRWAWLRSGWALFAVVLVLYWVSPVNATQSDPALVPLTAHSLLYDQDLSLDEFPSSALVGHPLVIVGSATPAGYAFSDVQAVDDVRAESGTDIYDYFPWTTALLLVPVIAANDAISSVAGTENSRELILDGRFGVPHRLAAGVVVALSAVVMKMVFLGLVTGSKKRRELLATGAAVTFALGTSAWSTASRALWQHAPSLLALAVALYLTVRLLAASDDEHRRLTAGRTAMLLGSVLAIAAIVRPTNLFVAVAIAVWVFACRRQCIVALICGASSIAALFAIVSAAIGAGAVPPYYAGSRFVLHEHFTEALAVNWISPGRGLLWASPIVLLAIPGFVRLVRDPESRVLAICIAGAIGAVWISVSGFDNWWAGHSYGARFMTEAVPLLFFLGIPAADAVFKGGDHEYASGRRSLAVVTVVLVLWSICFNGLGATSRIPGCWNTIPTNVDKDPGRVWDVVDSAFSRPMRYLILDLDPRRAWFGPC